MKGSNTINCIFVIGDRRLRTPQLSTFLKKLIMISFVVQIITQMAASIKMENIADSSNSLIPMVSAMELPCYLSLSDHAVKIGSSSFDDIQRAATKLNFVFNQATNIEVKFDPAIATWSGHSKKPDAMSDKEYASIKFDFVMCLWQREGVLLLETDYYGCERMFSEFYRTTLSNFVACK